MASEVPTKVLQKNLWDSALAVRSAYISLKDENTNLKRHVKSLKKQVKALNEQVEEFYFSDDSLREENERLCEEIKQLNKTNTTLVKRNVDARVEKDRVLAEKDLQVNALEGELKIYRGDYCRIFQELEDLKIKTAEKESELLDQINKLSEQNQIHAKNLTKFQKENAPWEKQPGDVVEQYFTDQCFEALAALKEDEQRILTWSIKTGFDPIEACKKMPSKFHNSEELRQDCLKKKQLEKEVTTFSKVLKNIKQEQFNDILSLHDKFAFYLKVLHTQAKNEHATQLEEFSNFKTQFSQQLRQIEEHIQGMDFGGSKIMQRFLDEQFCSCNQSQKLLIKRIQDHTKYNQEIRLPSIKSAVSSLSSMLSTFELKAFGLKHVHIRFLKVFKRIKAMGNRN